MSVQVAGDWLSRPATQAVLAALAGGGHRALFVGGCVRNALMGLPVSDVDIATDAPPERVIALAEEAGLRAVPTGAEHGTITVVSGGLGHEVTTFRRDVEAFGRRARVAFGTDIAEDAARRDFTMNALYADSTGHVVDPLGGLPDLLARRVRFVGDAERRITEDYLRILRFFRFLAQYGDPGHGPDAEALAACAGGIGGLEGLSAERITSELRKLLAAREPAQAVAAMAQTGVLGAIMAGAQPGALAVLEHLEAGEPCGWVCRLAALGGDTGALRLSRAEAGELERLRAFAATQATAGELGYRLGAQLGRAAVLLRAAQVSGPFMDPLPDGWRAQIERGAKAIFPLRAADLPGLEGAKLGQALKRAEAFWIASDFRAHGAELIAAAVDGA
jgi:poly(A) polymerase